MPCRRRKKKADKQFAKAKRLRRSTVKRTEKTLGRKLKKKKR